MSKRKFKKELWYRRVRGKIKWFFLRLFGKVSIFKGFDVHEGEHIKLRRNRKYLQIDHCLVHGGEDLPNIDIVK